MPQIDLQNMPERTPEAQRGRHGAMLRREREDRKLTQREVAERLSCDHKLIGRAEQGQASEEIFTALYRLYDLRDDGWPKDPLRRREFVDRRTERISHYRPTGIIGRKAA